MIELSHVIRRVTLPGGEALWILRGIDLVVGDGEVVAIHGRSGSGKSTLLNVVGLLDEPDGGDYLLNGRSTRGMSDREAAAVRGATFGFVFQAFHLLEGRTALQNVAAPLLHGSQHEVRARRQRAGELLERLGLGNRLQSTSRELSGGEQQRVAIARALVRNPRYVLADEPTGALDLATAEVVLAALLEVARERRGGLLIVTHDERVAAQADRVVVLAEGRVA